MEVTALIDLLFLPPGPLYSSHVTGIISPVPLSGGPHFCVTVIRGNRSVDKVKLVRMTLRVGKSSDTIKFCNFHTSHV